MALLCLIWGSTWIVIQGGLRDVPPITSAAARFVVAAIAMTAVAHFLHRREGGERPPWKLSLALGGLNFAASYGIVYWTETRLPSSLVSVLWSVFPMLTAISGHFFLPAERLRGRQWAGFAVVVLASRCCSRPTCADRRRARCRPERILLVRSARRVVGHDRAEAGGARVSSVLVNRNAMWIGAALLRAAPRALERGVPARLDPRPRSRACSTSRSRARS
jgi:uncharacterized membrane protein